MYEAKTLFCAVCPRAILRGTSCLATVLLTQGGRPCRGGGLGGRGGMGGVWVCVETNGGGGEGNGGGCGRGSGGGGGRR